MWVSTLLLKFAIYFVRSAGQLSWVFDLRLLPYLEHCLPGNVPNLQTGKLIENEIIINHEGHFISFFARNVYSKKDDTVKTVRLTRTESNAVQSTCSTVLYLESL